MYISAQVLIFAESARGAEEAAQRLGGGTSQTRRRVFLRCFFYLRHTGGSRTIKRLLHITNIECVLLPTKGTRFIFKDSPSLVLG